QGSLTVVPWPDRVCTAPLDSDHLDVGASNRGGLLARDWLLHSGRARADGPRGISMRAFACPQSSRPVQGVGELQLRRPPTEVMEGMDEQCGKRRAEHRTRGRVW